VGTRSTVASVNPTDGGLCQPNRLAGASEIIGVASKSVGNQSPRYCCPDAAPVRRRSQRVKMQLLTAQHVFRAMMRDQIAPALRELGFTGSGQIYLLPSETLGRCSAFRKSTV
jgi:hypothetical protein